MTMEKKPTYTIPKGYKGIAQKISLTFNTNLAVITGVNGCGKSTILKYLYENYGDPKKWFIKNSQENTARRVPRHRREYLLRQNRSYEHESFDDIIGRIERIQDLRFRNRVISIFQTNTDFYSDLFDQSSIGYQDKGCDYLEQIGEFLVENRLGTQESVAKKIGYVTDQDLETALINKLNENKQQNRDKYGFAPGKKINDIYRKKNFPTELLHELSLIEQKLKDKLKVTKRKNAEIKDEDSLYKYIHKLWHTRFRSIESVIDQMATKIYEDYQSNRSRRSNILWKNINKELEKYNKKGYFGYQLVSPKSYQQNYTISFKKFDKENTAPIEFDNLSTGEKIIFELICYCFAAKESDLEMIILDEFDANLNPSLAKQYIDVIRDQFSSIKVILTTHSPSTVAEIEPEELFELTSDHILTCAETQEGKKKIIQKLAPKFVYHGEFGILEDVLSTIFFVEGNHDVSNFEEFANNNKYKFIDSGGAGNMLNLVRVFKSIPFFKNRTNGTKIVFVFDFDTEGINKLCESAGGDSNQKIHKNIERKESSFYKVIPNLYLTHLIPPESHTWEYGTNRYGHKELKNEGEEAIKRHSEFFNSLTGKINNDQTN